MKNETTTKLLRLMLVLAVMALGIKANAQDNQSRFMVQTGLLYENGWDATIALEKETTYHSAVEYYVNGYTQWKTCESCGHICKKSLFNNYKTWEVGAAYKPCVSRSKNTHANARIGFGVGSDTHKIIGSIQLGYERDYCLKSNFQLYWQAKTAFVLNGKDKFRTGIAIGVKFPK